MEKKTITFLVLHLGYGGIESATIHSANALSSYYQVEILSFYNIRVNQTNLLNPEIKVTYLYDGEPNRDAFREAVQRKNPFAILKEGIKAVDILAKKRFLVAKAIKACRSHALISTRYDFNALVSRYARDSVLKIAQEHHHHNHNPKYISILSNQYGRIDYLFALTQSLAEDYREFLKKNTHTKIVVMPNMVPRIPPESASLRSQNIISICRLHEGKRLDELITIFSRLQNREAKLYLVGTGEEEARLKEQAAQLGLSDRIIFTGYLTPQQQKPYLLDAALYAMTSISEGLPMVLIEAMSWGVPCIAYQTDSGVTDIIADGENGRVIPGRDQDAYVQAVDSLLADSSALSAMGAKAKASASRFSQETVTQMWQKILSP